MQQDGIQIERPGIGKKKGCYGVLKSDGIVNTGYGMRDKIILLLRATTSYYKK